MSKNITEKLADLCVATNGEIYYSEWDGGAWMHEAVETQETIENWIESSATWNERSAMKRGEIANMPFVSWENVQVRKGDQRKSISVLDFGDCRYVISQDLTVF
jgi:hypothetical protein